MYRQVESLPKESLVVVCVPLPGVGGVLTDSSSQGLFEEERPRRVQGRDPGHPQSQPDHALAGKPTGVAAQAVANTVVTVVHLGGQLRE